MVDVVVKTMTITCERREKVDFSTQYFSAEQRIQVLQGHPSAASTTSQASGSALPGNDLGDSNPATPTRSHRRHRPDVVRLPRRPPAGAGGRDQHRRHDPRGPRLARPVSDDGRWLTGRRTVRNQVNKDNPDLVRFVNGTLDRIRSDGTWNRIYDRWLSVLGPSPGPRRPSTGIEADMTEETGPEPDATQASMRPEPEATGAYERPEPEATGAYERLEPTSAQIREPRRPRPPPLPAAPLDPAAAGRGEAASRRRPGRGSPRPADRPRVCGDG
ncbi:transporter substrate-binding domain-containing protein [Rhodococcus sp. 3Y1]